MIYIKPTVVVSRCLSFAPCRYDGQMLADPFIELLKKHVTVCTICPEMDLGLGVPREPICLIYDNDLLRLYQPAAKKDLTERAAIYTQNTLAKLTNVQGYILKRASPSSAIKDAKVYASNKSGVIKKGPGFFAREIKPGIPIEDEARLTNLTIREKFLIAIYTLADFAQVKKSERMQELVDFQSRNKLLLMALSEKNMRTMGKLVANEAKLPIDFLLAEYEEYLKIALQKNIRRGPAINVMQHAFGYFSNYLNQQEKTFFIDSIEKYRKGQIPLSSLQMLLGSYIARFGEPYLSTQSFFNPYPEALVSLQDTGKGREVE